MSYHSKHAYLQLQEWVVTTDQISPLEWGWESVNGKLFPMRTNLPPVPERLIKLTRYSCKLNCYTKKCSGRKHGLDCTVGCGDSKDVSCSNSNLKNITDADLTRSVIRTM